MPNTSRRTPHKRSLSFPVKLGESLNFLNWIWIWIWIWRAAVKTTLHLKPLLACCATPQGRPCSDKARPKLGDQQRPCASKISGSLCTLNSPITGAVAGLWRLSSQPPKTWQTLILWQQHMVHRSSSVVASWSAKRPHGHRPESFTKYQVRTHLHGKWASRR